MSNKQSEDWMLTDLDELQTLIETKDAEYALLQDQARSKIQDWHESEEYKPEKPMPEELKAFGIQSIKFRDDLDELKRRYAELDFSATPESPAKKLDWQAMLHFEAGVKWAKAQTRRSGGRAKNHDSNVYRKIILLEAERRWSKELEGEVTRRVVMIENLMALDPQEVVSLAMDHLGIELNQYRYKSVTFKTMENWFRQAVKDNFIHMPEEALKPRVK